VPVTIVYQDFGADGGDWNFTDSPAEYDLGSDEWHTTTSQGGTSASNGSILWGFQDIDNSTYVGDHTLTFDETSLSSHTNVILTFDWFSKSFNGSDEISYQVAYDGGAFGSKVILCSGCGGTGSWNTETININNSNTSVQLKLIGNQNGGGQHGGFDNVILKGEVVAASPILTATPSSLTGFTYEHSSGPSTVQSFALSGSDLDGTDVTITASTNYEVSNSNSPFSATSPITLSTYDGSSQTIYVRLKAGLSVATYNSETIIIAGGGDSDGETVSCSGEVTAAPDLEPTNHATSFATTVNSSSEIELNWNDNDGAQAASNFLLLANTTGSFTNPVDGTTQADDTDLSDGSAIVNIAHGVQTHTFNSLTANTQYYFTIYPYSNSGTDVNYKTNSTIPTTDGTTCANLTVPNATAGSGIGTTSFTANWDAVTGTESYRLDVYTSGGGSELVLNSGFETGDNTGWTTFESQYVVTGTDGSVSPYSGSYMLKCDASATRDLAQDITYTADGSTSYELSFWYRHDASSSGNSRLWSSFSSGSFTGDDISPSTYLTKQTSWTQVTYTITPASGSNTLHMEFRTYNGCIIYLDDFSFKESGGGTSYVTGYENKTVNGTSHSVTSLSQSTEYKYVVRAYSSCGASTTTANSNEITVTTLAGVTPTLAVSTASISNLDYFSGYGPSTEQSFTLSGTDLDGTDVTLTPPTNFEISKTSSGGYVSNPATLTYTTYNGSDQTIYVRLKAGLSVNTYNGDVAIAGGGDADGETVSLGGSIALSSSTDIIAVSSSESATVSSIENTSGPLNSTQGVQVWQFTIRDGGASGDDDAEPTIVTQLNFSRAAGNTIEDWDEAILSADLFDGSTHLATATITATQLQFSASPIISVADNTSKTITLRISISTTPNSSGNNNDGDDFGFQLSQSNTSADATGSGFSSFSAISSTNGQNVFSVIATELQFVKQPTNAVVDVTMSPDPTIKACDINGNIDLC